MDIRIPKTCNNLKQEMLISDWFIWFWEKLHQMGKITPLL